MKRIIEEVLQAEQKVNTALKQAREKASEILRTAEKETSEKITQAREQSLEIMQTMVEEAKKEGERYREEKLKKVDQEKEALIQNNADATNALIDDICRIVLNTENQNLKYKM